MSIEITPELLEELNMTQWKSGVPKDRKGHFLLLFRGGVICSGRHRYGHPGEPQQNVSDWRCDCCGCFGTPVAYANHPCPEEFAK